MAGREKPAAEIRADGFPNMNSGEVMVGGISRSPEEYGMSEWRESEQGVGEKGAIQTGFAMVPFSYLELHRRPTTQK